MVSACHEDTLAHAERNEFDLIFDINHLSQYKQQFSSEEIVDMETLCIMVRRDFEDMLIAVDDIFVFLKIIDEMN
tara:strand:+ start:270 stop:494 length:225 start_codon:yes stop_codon:yes gene_type:complete